MNKIIISGATGYFGSLAQKYLEESGYEVQTAGKRESSDIYFDLNKPVQFAETKSETASCFIHAAAVNEVICVNSPYDAVSQNVASTRAALDFCVRNGIQQFIYLSTFHVYGVDSGLVDESTPARPLNDYGLTHFQAEEYVRMYTRKGLIEGVCLRPSNMFDTPVNLNNFNRWSLIPFSFCKNALDDGRIELKTAGMQERNFVSVRDITSVIQKVLNLELKEELINVPGVTSLSIKDFALLVKEVVKREFGKGVDVIVPDGGAFMNKLKFKSNFFCPSDLGFIGIEDHIVNFCRVLRDEK